jgi:hypothetical protein
MKDEPIPYAPTLEPQGKVVIRLTDTTWLFGYNGHEPEETTVKGAAFRFAGSERAQSHLDSIVGLKRWGDARLEVVR